MFTSLLSEQAIFSLYIDYCYIKQITGSTNEYTVKAT